MTVTGLTNSTGDVELGHLPREVACRARVAIAALEAGVSLKVLRGKRMRFDRTIVRIPVGYRYRLLCRQYEGGFRPLRVVSHEVYNRVARNKAQP